MPGFGKNKSDGLGIAVRKGSYATADRQLRPPIAKFARPCTSESYAQIEPFSKVIGEAISRLGHLSALVVDGTRSVSKRVADIVFERECFKIDAGQCVDAPGGQIDESQRS